MSAPPRPSLLDAPVMIEVAQPWDFASDDGEGRLAGYVRGVRTWPGLPSELEIAVTPFVVAGRRYDTLRAVARFPREGDPLARLGPGRGEAVNLFCHGGEAPLLVGAVRLA